MIVFAVLLRWSSKSNDSVYPSIPAIEAIPNNDVPAAVEFRDAVQQFAHSVAVEPSYIYYARVASEKTVITLAIYKSKEDYEALRLKHDLVFARLEQVRGPYCAARGLECEEKHASFDYGSFDEAKFEEVNQFFDSIPDA